MTKMIFATCFLFAGISAQAAADAHPCAALVKACEAGGYQKGEHKKDGKGLYIDCLDKLNQGASVPGVTVNADDVAACKAKHAMKK